MNKKTKGTISEYKVITKLLELGYTVSTPIGDNARYDLIADTGENLIRIQVKTGWVHNDVVMFNCFGVTWNRTSTYTKEYTLKQVDVFLIYCPETDDIYKYPVGKVKLGYLRIKPTKNNQNKGIVWAKDHIFTSLP